MAPRDTRHYHEEFIGLMQGGNARWQYHRNGVNDRMEQFTEILRTATAAVPGQYFLLPLHGAGPIYRERVYCYELYHQLRRLWPEDTHYQLNGEVDKRNHPYFQNEEQPKPDLLVHRPGTGDNFAAVEVKPSGAANGETIKDLVTLMLLAQRAAYRRLIYLIYGEGAEQDLQRVNGCAARVEGMPAIELWLHPTPGTSADIAGILNSPPHPPAEQAALR
jgi:hypothetical protein